MSPLTLLLSLLKDVGPSGHCSYSFLLLVPFVSCLIHTPPPAFVAVTKFDFIADRGHSHLFKWQGASSFILLLSAPGLRRPPSYAEFIAV